MLALQEAVPHRAGPQTNESILLQLADETAFIEDKFVPHLKGAPYKVPAEGANLHPAVWPIP